MKQDGAYWIEKLALSPHAEGGWYRELWRSDLVIPKDALPPPYGGDRSACTLIHYLLKRGEESSWHRVRSAEIWLWHAGGALELRLGGSGEKPDAGGAGFLLGTDPATGECFQAAVPPQVWQSAGVREGAFVLVSCVVSPGFHWEDFSLPPGNVTFT
jgi:predicted cupin superfamily sugar epimerase